MYSRFTLIDELTLNDHWYLTKNDNCFYLGEYTARQGYAYSNTNQLIINFKKSVDRAGKPEYQHKTNAIEAIANDLNLLIDPSTITFVPVPPSKAKSDPLYDDRLIKTLDIFKQANGHTDYRELVVQTNSYKASHDTDDRPTPDELINIYEVDAKLVEGVRQGIVIFDDVITTGCHFNAMKHVLGDRFPNHDIMGLFIARRVPLSDDPTDFADFL